LDNFILLSNNIFFAPLTVKISPGLKAWRSLDRSAIPPKIEVIPKNRKVLVILLIASHHSPDNVFRAYYPQAKTVLQLPAQHGVFQGKYFLPKG